MKHVLPVLTGFTLSVAAFAGDKGPQTSAQTERTAAAADATVFPIPKLDGSIWERQRLLGDPGGSRQWLAEHGVQFDYTLVQYYQGVMSGGDTNQWAINVGTNAVRTLTGEIIDQAAVRRVDLRDPLAPLPTLSSSVAVPHAAA